jgi:histidinol-phosphate/aromatic aminotransferase/cobyric acid decarboxylase-like protein
VKLRQPYNLDHVTRTVYTLYWDEVMAVQDQLWKDRRHDLFMKTYERSQIEMHVPFLDRWRTWSNVGIRKRAFPFAYPASGGTEALDTVMRSYRRVHVFKGDYEGYRQLADADNRELIEHVRRVEVPAKHHFDEGDAFIVSYPSAIDGELWPDLDNWLENMRSKYPKVDIILDMAYRGCTKTPIALELYRHSNVETVVFSFSKPFGLSQHRVGGAFCRHVNRRLEYNKYFKNLPGIILGNQLMEAYEPTYIPQRYAKLQQAALEAAQANKEAPTEAVCSDAIMLARAASGQKEFERTPGQFRFCLTKAMDQLHHSPGLRPPLQRAELV